jgi:hypothetical protein
VGSKTAPAVQGFENGLHDRITPAEQDVANEVHDCANDLFFCKSTPGVVEIYEKCTDGGYCANGEHNNDCA